MDGNEDKRNGSSSTEVTEHPEGDMEHGASVADEDIQDAIVNDDILAQVTLAQRSCESTSHFTKV